MKPPSGRTAVRAFGGGRTGRGSSTSAVAASAVADCAPAPAPARAGARRQRASRGSRACRRPPPHARGGHHRNVGHAAVARRFGPDAGTGVPDRGPQAEVASRRPISSARIVTTGPLGGFIVRPLVIVAGFPSPSGRWWSLLPSPCSIHLSIPFRNRRLFLPASAQFLPPGPGLPCSPSVCGREGEAEACCRGGARRADRHVPGGYAQCRQHRRTADGHGPDVTGHNSFYEFGSGQTVRRSEPRRFHPKPPERGDRRPCRSDGRYALEDPYQPTALEGTHTAATAAWRPGRW